MQTTSLSITQVSYYTSTTNKAPSDADSAQFKTYSEALENGLKEAVNFSGASGVFSFHALQDNSVVQISMTDENISRFKERFGSEIIDNGDKQYSLSGKAEKYMGAFWEYFKEKQPDTNKDGYINFEEYKKGSSILVGYDEENKAPITAEVSSSMSDEELKMMGINQSSIESVDQLFNDLLKYDENIDGIISKCELSEGMTQELGSAGKDSAFTRWLLWFIEGMQDEEKEKKAKENEQLDTMALKRKLTEGVDALPNTKDSGKLSELLQNLKTSLK